MRKLVIALGLMTCCFQPPAHAAADVGVGIILGEPTGISFHSWLPGNNVAAQFAAGWRTSNNKEIHVQADYLRYDMQRIPIEGGYLPLYYGVGVRIVDDNDDDTRVGVRIPFGLNYFFKSTPVDVFFELAPVLDLVPDTDFDLNGGIGIRFRFR